MNIKTLHIDQIRPYWRNPRKNEKAVEAVKASIDKYGYNQPIVVDKENVIIVGHTRYKALRQLGYEDIEVNVKNISEEKAKEYRIADNKSGEKAEWDEDLLMYELREIEELDDMKVFFDNGEIDNLLDIANEEYDLDEDDQYDEEQRRNELQEKARQEIAESMNQDETSDEDFEERVSAKVENDMRDEIREEMRREQEKVQAENQKIKDLEEKTKARFSDGSEQKEDDYIEIECPHCEEKYVLSKSELLRAQKLQ